MTLNQVQVSGGHNIRSICDCRTQSFDSGHQISKHLLAYEANQAVLQKGQANAFSSPPLV